MSAVHANVLQLKKMIRNLDAWLGKAEAYAQTRGFDVNNLLTARLAPDQFPLARQVQAACDAAKLCGARMAGKSAPKHEDTETTVEQLRARTRAVVDFLGTLAEADFEGAEDRSIELPFAPGMTISGDDYLYEMGTANAYFHLCMVYALLRHNGVPLGKQDYIGGLNLRPAAAS